MESFEEVGKEDRRLEMMKVPEHWECGLPESLLSKCSEELKEIWILSAINAKKLDWVIRETVERNNAMFHVETEVRRNQKFRAFIYGRITLISAAAGIFAPLLFKLILDMLK